VHWKEKRYLSWRWGQLRGWRGHCGEWKEADVCGVAFGDGVEVRRHLGGVISIMLYVRPTGLVGQ